MLYHDFSAELLGLQEVIVTNGLLYDGFFLFPSCGRI